MISQHSYIVTTDFLHSEKITSSTYCLYWGGLTLAFLHAKISGACPPIRDPILSYSHTFSPKRARLGGPRSLREILDPPLTQKMLKSSRLWMW